MIDDLEELYRAERPQFYRAAAAIAGDPALGEDAVQEAFAKAVRKRRSFRGRGSLEAWVWRIVVNTARDARRRRPRRCSRCTSARKPQGWLLGVVFFLLVVAMGVWYWLRRDERY